MGSNDYFKAYCNSYHEGTEDHSVNLDSLTSECLALDPKIVFTFEIVDSVFLVLCFLFCFFSHKKIILELFNPLKMLIVTFVEDESFFLCCKTFSSALSFQCLANEIKAFTCIKTKV